MPKIREISAPIRGYAESTTLEDDWELVHGVATSPSLPAKQARFIDDVLNRSIPEPPPKSAPREPVCESARLFGRWIDAAKLRQAILRCPDERFDDLCRLALTLRLTHDGVFRHAAKLLIAKCDAFLARAEGDPAQRGLIQEARIGARWCLQEYFERQLEAGFNSLDPMDRLLAMRQHAECLAESFGVHHGSEALGRDFILDAGGNVAYAFKPLLNVADGADRARAVEAVIREVPRALTVSRVCRELAPALPAVQACETDLVTLRGRWGPQRLEDLATGDGDGSDDAQLGLLTRAPAGFHLHLDDIDPGSDRAARRLDTASQKPLNLLAFEQAALLRLCLGQLGGDLKDALVDNDEQVWLLGHADALPDDFDGAALSHGLFGQLLDPLGARAPQSRADMGARLVAALADINLGALQVAVQNDKVTTARMRRLLESALTKEELTRCALDDRQRERLLLCAAEVKACAASVERPSIDAFLHRLTRPELLLQLSSDQAREAYRRADREIASGDELAQRRAFLRHHEAIVGETPASEVRA